MSEQPGFVAHGIGRDRDVVQRAVEGEARERRRSRAPLERVQWRRQRGPELTPSLCERAGFLSTSSAERVDANDAALQQPSFELAAGDHRRTIDS